MHEDDVIEDENKAMFDRYSNRYAIACNAAERAMYPQMNEMYPPEVSVTSKQSRAVVLAVFQALEAEGVEL